MHPFASVLNRVITVSLLSSVWCSHIQGQWIVAAEIGAERYWGGSVENTATRRSFRPYRPTTLGLGLERRTGSLGAGLRLRYTAASLGLEGGDAVAAIKGVFDVYSAMPEFVYRIASFGSGNELLLRAGPLLEVWSIIDENSRTRIGIQGAVSVSVPLAGRLGGSLLAGAALTSSPFEPEQLDPDFERRALWRRGVAARLEYRL
jgi:hypothetical protein